MYHLIISGLVFDTSSDPAALDAVLVDLILAGRFTDRIIRGEPIPAWIERASL